MIDFARKYLLGVIAVLILVGIALFSRSDRYESQQVETGTPEPQPVEEVQSLVPGAPVVRRVPANTGRVVFAISDAAVSLDELQAILVTISEIRVHNTQSGAWVTVLKNAKQYDLLKLYKENATELMADIGLPAGSYNQIRLLVDTAVIVKDGQSFEAKLPSKELKINTQLEVVKNENSAVIFDFLAAKSVHVTGDGQYIFAPVVKLDTLSTVRTFQIFPNNKLDIIGGVSRFSAMVGMNEEGELKPDFSFNPRTEFLIVKGAVKVVNPEEVVSINISAEAALDKAVQSGNLDSAISIKTVSRNNKLVWRIVGRKDAAVTIVYIDVATGDIIGVE